MAASKIGQDFQENSAFAILAINNVYTCLPTTTFQLSENIRVTTCWPIPESRIWKKSMGTIRMERLVKSNLVLVIEETSENPGVLDDVHIRLATDLRCLFSMLHLHPGIKMVRGADLVCGFFVNGVSQIRQVGRMPQFFQSKNWPRKPITRDRLEDSVVRRGGMVELEKDPALFRRVRRGLHTLLKGLREGTGADRLHQIVRSLEALVYPEQGRTTKHFVHRCQTFAKPGEDTSAWLKEAYDMRSNTEHLHPLDQCEDVCWQRTRQIEHLACSAYSRLLCDPDIRMHFETDDAIDEFWRLRDHERRCLWGTPLDLSQIP